MKFAIHFVDGHTEEIEAEYWVKHPQPDGPAWAHFHGTEDICDERCHVVDEVNEKGE